MLLAKLGQAFAEASFSDVFHILSIDDIFAKTTRCYYKEQRSEIKDQRIFDKIDLCNLILEKTPMLVECQNTSDLEEALKPSVLVRY